MPRSLSPQKFIKLLSTMTEEERLITIRRFAPKAEPTMTTAISLLGVSNAQTLLIFAMNEAFKGNNKVLEALIGKLFATMKGLEVSGKVDHTHSAVLKQIEGMSDNDKSKIVGDFMKKKARGELPVPPDYEIEAQE